MDLTAALQNAKRIEVMRSLKYGSSAYQKFIFHVEDLLMLILISMYNRAHKELYNSVPFDLCIFDIVISSY